MLARRSTAYVLLFINTLIWGAALIIVKPAYEFISPTRFLFWRFLLAGTVTLPVLVYYLPRVKHLARSVLRITILEILGTSVALGALYWGLNQTSAITASLIANATPVFVTLTGIFLLKEREEKHEWLGLFLATLGTSLVILWPAWSRGVSLGGGAFHLNGIWLVLAHNLATALYLVGAKKWYLGLPKIWVAAVSFWVGVISFGLLSWWEAGFNIATWTQSLSLEWQAPSVWFAVIYMAILGSVVALTAYIKGQELIETSEASLFWYLQPAVYLPLGVVLLGEQISWGQLVGLSLVILGVGVAEQRRRRSVTRSKPLTVKKSPAPRRRATSRSRS
jgi:drug/metabolite transporter (DMT)-like permease